MLYKMFLNLLQALAHYKKDYLFVYNCEGI